MKIYKCVAKSREHAISEAIRKYGVDIQVVYEREFLYGLFNRKWVEVGFFLKSAEESEDEARYASPDCMNVVFAANRIFKFLSENEFSPEVIEYVVGRFYSDVSERRSLISLSAISDFLSGELTGIFRTSCFPSDSKWSSAHDSGPVIVASPFEFDRSRFLSRLASRMHDTSNTLANRVVVANIGRNDSCEFAGVRTERLSDLDELQRLRDGLDGELIVVNMGCERFGDDRYAAEVAEVLSSTPKESLLVLLPSYAKSSCVIESVAGRSVSGLAWTLMSGGDRIGGMVSTSFATGIRNAYFDYAGGMLECDEKTLLRHCSVAL